MFRPLLYMLVLDFQDLNTRHMLNMAALNCLSPPEGLDDN